MSADTGLTAHTTEDVHKALIADVRAGLHELCQPMATLQCLLELGTMETTMAESQVCIVDALEQCARMNGCVTALREAVLRAMAAGADRA